jgi:hypothetical protein
MRRLAPAHLGARAPSALTASLLALALWASLAPAQSVRLVLKWKEAQGASAYELQIARDSAFVEVVLQTRTTAPAYRWEHLPEATHWWRVRSVDADGRPSEWSLPRTVSVDSAVPALLRPSEGTKAWCGKPVEVELEPSVLVKEYQLEVSRRPDFASPTVLRQATPRFALEALAPGPWYARAGAVDVRGRQTGPGPTRSFVVRVAAPRLKPTTDAWLSAAQLALAWDELPCAASYLVELVDELEARVATPAAEPKLTFKATAAGDSRWRVAAVDEDGTTGEWSPEARFRVKLPSPQPRGEQVRHAAELSWSPVPSAVSYRVVVTAEGVEPSALEGPALKARILEGLSSGTQWRTPPLEVGRYRWQVEARDARGHVSALSPPRSFERLVVSPLPAPELQAHLAQVEVGARLEVSWGPVEGATEYQVELDGEALAATGATTFRSGRLVEGWHWVRVRALATPLKESPYSSPLEVFAGVPPVVAAQVVVAGDRVTVGVVDRLGRPVSGATPTFAAQRGGLAGVAEEDGRWTMRWRPPPSGEDVLEVTVGDFLARHPLRWRRSGWLAASLGFIANGGAVGSAWGAVTAGVPVPWLDDRLGVELRVGVYGAEATTVLGGATYHAAAWLVPGSLLVSWQERLGDWRVRGAAGPSAQLAVVRVNEVGAMRVLGETTVLPGVELSASVSRLLGPGRVELELGFLYARLDSSLARLNAGGAGVRLGYVLEL